MVAQMLFVHKKNFMSFFLSTNRIINIRTDDEIKSFRTHWISLSSATTAITLPSVIRSHCTYNVHLSQHKSNITNKTKQEDERERKKFTNGTLLNRHSLGAHWHKWESGKMRFKHFIYRKLNATKNLGWWCQSQISIEKFDDGFFSGGNGRTIFA